VPKYKVLIHRRVHKFSIELKNEKVKNQIKDAITNLEDYPFFRHSFVVRVITDYD